MPSLQEQAFKKIVGADVSKGGRLDAAAYRKIIEGGIVDVAQLEAVNERVDVNADAISAVSEDVTTLGQKVSALQGVGGYLTAYDFGAATPSQSDITAYALSQIGITDQSQIFNGTRVKNLSDNHLWILTNTPTTDPPVFEWTDDGLDSVTVLQATGNDDANPMSQAATTAALAAKLDKTGAITALSFIATGGEEAAEAASIASPTTLTFYPEPE